MTETIILLLQFIAIYSISDKLSNYTLLNKYKFYDDLSMKLYDYQGRFKSFLTKLYYFKLFNCQSCNVFWISLVINSIFMTNAQLILPLSLIMFCIHKLENNVQ